MSKNPKSVVVSFRLSPLAIAKAIDGLKAYDKSSDITRLSAIVKQATLHGVNYLTNALPWEPSEESQIIVHNLTTQGKAKTSFESGILGKAIKVSHINTKAKSKEPKETSYFDTIAKENIQASKSVVTDFSIPKDLLDKAKD